MFGHGGHLEFRIKTILAIFHSPSAWMLHMKFGYIWPRWFQSRLAQFQRRSRLKVWTDDGGLPYYKLPRSLRLRGAKNLDLSYKTDLAFLEC